MDDLRVLLRYGIVGYMVLFFDLIFVCSYVDLQKFLILVADTQLGIIVGIMGLPIGWLCYQLWDQCINLWWIPNLPNIKKIREWEQEARDELERDGGQVGKHLPTPTIKVIANVSLVYLKKKGASSTRDDPRRLQHSLYSDSQQARGVTCFVLPCATYFSYTSIGLYMALKFEWFYAFSPKDKIVYFMALLLPVLVSAISYCGLNRVKGEQSDHGWAILSDKKDEIKELIKKFYGYRAR